MDAISSRRSIRKFTDKDIDKQIIKNIIKAGIDAPSPKNNQPWKFVVITKERKHELIDVIHTGIEKVKHEFELLLDEKNFLSSIEATLKIMKEAPVIIFVINTENRFSYKLPPVKKFIEMANIQSIGASVENILLASLEYGIGSLWISDIYYTIFDIGKWLNTDRQIVAAIALGYPAENPAPVPRKDIDELIEWR